MGKKGYARSLIPLAGNALHFAQNKRMLLQDKNVIA
jgi:hypothetical protein